MKKCDIEFGMKVVPFQKTAKGWTNLQDSINWQIAKVENQPYLYVSYFDENEGFYVLGLEDELDGDYFNPEDFEPYQEI